MRRDEYYPISTFVKCVPPAANSAHSQFQLFSTPARARAAETLKLERTLSDLVNQAYALTPAEIALMWQTAPPRMPIPLPSIMAG